MGWVFHASGLVLLLNKCLCLFIPILGKAVPYIFPSPYLPWLSFLPCVLLAISTMNLNDLHWPLSEEAKGHLGCFCPPFVLYPNLSVFPQTHVVCFSCLLSQDWGWEDNVSTLFRISMGTIFIYQSLDLNIQPHTDSLTSEQNAWNCRCLGKSGQRWVTCH